ncbi:hypothetical protein TRFO_11011 [Tritrichomonas foetus]|uniref:Uncharacterized protein n=1 Tax=Tritrichomonas foetus TaxID=1144522 RepID=A0A1J4JAG0_9EUKA|nr:hypothetical protein TRFO_11011 [Tritrichomonas foetus]|eukprot:OHS94627.1 hypothetical protein TRFO_11011 [Tritrichomonas foetus]
MPAPVKNEVIQDLLASDEFIISSDPSCHLVQGIGKQFSITPAIVFLTNRHVFVLPTVKKIDLEIIVLSDVSEIKIVDMSEYLSCSILSIQEQQRELNIFIPEPDQQRAFLEITKKLVAALENGQIDCDSLALSLQRRFIESDTIGSFYQTVSANKDNLVEQPPVDMDPTFEMLNHFTPAPVRLVDVVSNMMSMGDFFVFAVLSTIIGIFSILFFFIPFGVFVCGLSSIIITRYGFQLIFSKRPRKTNLDLFNKESPQIQSYLRSYEIFTEGFKKRILWRNPRSTLETVMFLLSTAAMFIFFDSAFVLTISMFGLAFVERWNPFGFGSAQEIFSALFQL